MKTIAAELLASNSLCACLRVERSDGAVVGFTSADRDVTVATGNAKFDGVYSAATGLQISNLVVQAGLAVDNMELTVLPDDTTYPQVDILAGRWDRAAFRLFETDYRDPTRVNLLKRGTTGQADTLRSTNRFEFHGLKRALSGTLGVVTSIECRYRFGSQAEPLGLCMLDLHEFTFTYEVTAVGSRYQFTCVDATEADDYYGEGICHAEDGANAGQPDQKIKSFAAGVFTLALPFPFPLQAGDTVTVTAGCRKRWDVDCRDKFDNLLNFGGEKDTPGADLLTADPEVSQS